MMRSRFIVTASLVLPLLFGVACRAVDAELNKLTKAEKQAGWKLLFDGKTTEGWRNYRKEGLSDGWQVVDGVLTRAKNGAGDIMTKEQFSSFDLVLEYKISKGGNSGLMFHVTEDAPAPWQTGPEIQIQDNVDGHDPQKAGWLYQLYPAQSDATRPAGEWNRLRIRITPQQSVIYMNGVRYARFQKGSDDWNQRVAKSKFSQYENFGKPTTGHIVLQDHGNPVAFRNIKVRELKPGGETPEPIDGELAVRAEVAFPKLKWADWEPVDDSGIARPLRPIVVTDAGDGSNRLFVATQRGVVHVFPNEPDVEASKVFLDIEDQVAYSDRQNEEGLLGLAFHPKFEENGEFYIYYTTREEPNTSIISRFRVSSDDPDRAAADFEEEVMRIKQPYWNHNGGTIAFGPDGYLYVGLGDGGAGNDPHGNAQNLGTLLGSILRIDVDKKGSDKAYAIPADNPFVGREDAQPEIYAYGLRNVWRLAFDRATGDLWAADVGQNLWEEINIIRKGGNYGWNLREATHMFGPNGSGPREDLIEPVWEYDHEVGKSVTGGFVYRGEAVPELQGKYVYADYISGKLWALDYDRETGEVVGNYSIPSPMMQVLSFGEDQQGEAYFCIVAPNGQGIYRLVRDK